MIQLSTIPVEDNTDKVNTNENSDDWKTLLSQCKISTQDLLKAVDLETHPLANSDAEKLFELKVPQPYIDKIEKGNPGDPLLLQVLPQNTEFLNIDGYSANPLNESQFSPAKGLIHKYKNRVLLISSATCAINCRYCFRRTFPYQEHRQSKSDWQEALNYIRKNSHITEVILSGGDPLTHNNDYLFWLLTEIDAISHIKRIRIHSRLITSLPQRVDKGFLEGINTIKAKLIIVTHCNHANELGAELESIFFELKARDVTLLNQSVLLKSVNDKKEILTRLSETLFSMGVMPYYLFILDPVEGAAHFDINIQQARALYKELLSTLPGYLVPKLSVEIPGQTAKTPIGLTSQEINSSHIEL